MTVYLYPRVANPQSGRRGLLAGLEREQQSSCDDATIGQAALLADVDKGMSKYDVGKARTTLRDEREDRLQTTDWAS